MSTSSVNVLPTASVGDGGLIVTVVAAAWAGREALDGAA
jgi:hypothetical protein